MKRRFGTHLGTHLGTRFGTHFGTHFGIHLKFFLHFYSENGNNGQNRRGFCPAGRSGTGRDSLKKSKNNLTHDQ